MFFATFAGCYAADKFSAVFHRLLGMKRALCAGKSLADHARVFINQYRHVRLPFRC